MTRRSWPLALWLLAAAQAASAQPSETARCRPTNAAAVAAARHVPAAAFPAHTGRVVDQAGLLTTAQESALTQRLEQLERRTGDQLVVVTVPSLRGHDIAAYGVALGNRWRIGQRGRNNGVLLIVAPNERRVRIEVGYGLERVLTNARSSEIIRQDILPHFRDSAFAAGISAGSRAIVATLIARAHVPRAGGC